MLSGSSTSRRPASSAWFSWGNPSSIYAEAREARMGLDAARRGVAAILGAKPSEIVGVTRGPQEAG